ncbi:MAG TPA: phosphate ABC transporter substrate-binding protein PstS [Candidatus Angelobacter sp.]|nr:phosphate ABC transporter substrate-binding protein PstS [Candidatus Angelobacter sp.]
MTVNRRNQGVILGLIVMLIACNGCNNGQGSTDVLKLQGAGASFPAPLYLKWFKAYSSAHNNVQVDYQSVGSGSGVKSFVDKTVDFGASDAAMKPEDIARVETGVQLLPMTAGAIVLTYNLKDVSGLKLSRKAYSGIFLGKITKWNDPLIAKTNPGVALPASAIHVVVRADSSGTTFVFSKHLSTINEEFAKSPGTNNMPDWPVGTRAKGNEGVTASVMTTPGSIGYVEYGYARGQNLAMTALENKSGEFVTPSTASGQAALASAQMPENMIVWASDPDAKDAYPIVTYTWLLLYKKYPDKKKFAALQDLLNYGLTDGQKDSEALGYLPLPQSVVDKDKAALKNIKSE